MSLIIILFAIFSFVNSNCWTQFNEECLSFTYENKSYSASQCVWNNYYEDGWCATKLDEDSAEVEEYGVCEKKDESCQVFECYKDPINGKLMKALTHHDGIYTSPSDTRQNYEESFQYCNTFGSMATIQPDQTTYPFNAFNDLNLALSQSEFYWVGYKAVNDQLHPLLKGSSTNANRSQILDHEYEDEAWAEIVDEEKCIAAKANTPWDTNRRPDFEAKPCSRELQVLCAKECIGNVWGYGQWSNCEKILNQYVQERQAVCQTPGSLEPLEEGECDVETKPDPQSRTCSEELEGMRCLGTWARCCTEYNPCNEGDGDCDTDDQCYGQLRCGENNCGLNGTNGYFEAHSDCCEDFEEWTEWSQIEPCTIDHYEASDNSSFYSTWQRTCTGGQCKLQLEEKLVLCEPINGNWSAWQDANDTECFETVHGNWIKLIYRTCSNPEPVNGGSCQEDQEGNGTKAILCTPVSGGWSNWTLANDSYCFKDNDKWFKEFKRACNNPDPIFGGSCEGNDTKLEECKPIDGKWSSWISSDEDCLLEEGNWMKPAFRRCDSPPPLFGGNLCQGQNQTKLECQPVDGEWSEWVSASLDECQEDQNGNWTRPRHRTCNNPEPKFNGQDCPLESGNASTTICHPVNGNWSEFGNWSSCFQLDDDNWYQQASRNCTEAKYGGFCIPDEHGNETIFQECLPIDGGWSEWISSDDSQCSETILGVWVKPGYRLCNNPVPSFGGQNCKGSGNSTVVCQPIDGGWSDFENWSECNFDCVTNRNRSCDNPAPKFNGKSCEGKSFEEKFCVDPNCYAFHCLELKRYSGYDLETTPNLGNMTAKQCQEVCESTVGCKGFMLISPDAPKREPSCTLKRVLKNGKIHQNGYIISGPAKCPDPPVHGGWTNVDMWMPCKNGQMKGFRYCANPEPANGGNHCEGDNAITKACNTTIEVSSVKFQAGAE